MKQKLIPCHVSQIKNLTERHDTSGQRIPFSICYACLDGAIVDVSEPVIVCIGVEPRYHRRKIKAVNSGEIRTIYDSLILRINNSKIIVN